MPLKERQIKSEILDELDAKDPQARRSRQDLRRINLFMGNTRWIREEIQQLTNQTDTKLNIIEIGSGDGYFLESLKHIKGLNLKGVDLQPKPKSISSEIEWIQEDVLEISDLPQNNSDPTAVICNLILHHFTDDQLFKLGKLISKANHIIINEPSRRLIPLLMGYLAFPLLGKVTRHDMIISIRAGFRDRELLKFFPSKNCLMIKETLRGGIRCHLS